ncbi:unnamed protein product [Boreogadus saida]
MDSVRGVAWTEIGDKNSPGHNRPNHLAKVKKEDECRAENLAKKHPGTGNSPTKQGVQRRRPGPAHTLGGGLVVALWLCDGLWPVGLGRITEYSNSSETRAARLSGRTPPQVRRNLS